MRALHQGSLGREPSARTVMRYRREVKRGNWAKMVNEVVLSVKSIRNNFFRLRSGEPLGENEGSRLYLFGRYLLFVTPLFQARPGQSVLIDPFSKITRNINHTI